jgi:hypothetical protein
MNALMHAYPEDMVLSPDTIGWRRNSDNGFLHLDCDNVLVLGDCVANLGQPVDGAEISPEPATAYLSAAI